MNSPPDGTSAQPWSFSRDPNARLTFDALERAVRATEPAAFLLLPRILRRVIKQDRMLAGFGIRVPHRKSYVIGRDALLEIVDRSELGLPEGADVPERAFLLARPGVQKLADMPADVVLIGCWRLLFHARVHAALDNRAAEGLLTPAVIRRRMEQLGPAEFEEIRMVLGQEDMLLPPRSDASIYTEFVAVYAELRRFAPSFLPRYFPGLADLPAVDAIIAQDVDAGALFRATRPKGAPSPKDPSELALLVELPAEIEDVAIDNLALPGGGSTAAQEELGRQASTESERSWLIHGNSPHSAPVLKGEKTDASDELKYRLLMRKSQRPAEQGNVVRAAIYRARAERYAPPKLASRVRTAIRMDVQRLIDRLQAALELDGASPQPWRESLFALVHETPNGFWTAEAKLLYDLQKVCIDHEREIYTVDLVEWALSWGRRPIKRQLPNQRDVLMLKHLGSAVRRLAAVHISDQHRTQLALLLQEAQHRVESRLREQLRPQIVAALDTVGLASRNLPERVARKKMVEELLDQVAERGFLTMGDLRDAISRNNLKLPDLLEPMDFVRGDRLLRADRKLALVLDGVYRRGEFYLRWMQRVSSLAFGTTLGRFCTRFAAVPFGGAYVVLGGLHHLWELVGGAKEAAATSESAGAAVEGFRLTAPPMVLALGLFLMCLVNSALFRRAVWQFFKTSYRVFNAIVVEPIRRVVQSPLLQQILHSRLFSILFRVVVKPLAWTGLAWLLLPKENWQHSAGMATAIFLSVNLALNSRIGRNLEELVADEIVQAWHRFGLRAILGAFWAIVDFFKAILDTIERLMYSVDEWLRFKSGESNRTLAIKAALGLVWFFFAYVFRFCVNVLIEPQINPIKHFPVVTVSHKLLLGLYKPFADLLEVKLGLGEFAAWGVATGTIWGIPGIFGFLVWELTANWRLYAANRRPNLSPVHVGSHGETMARLLKTGFHSGTVPKRYAKLRRAERRARAGAEWRPVRKQLQVLHHIEASIRRYVEREFLELFAESRSWQGPPVTLEEVRLGVNSVRLAIGCRELGENGTPLSVALEVESGWLMAGVTQAGWADRLPPQQRDVLITALLGLYKTAGVELVRQQIEDRFAPQKPWYDISAAGLVVWPEEQEDVEVVYDLHEEAWIAPQIVFGLPRRQLPTVERRQIVFSDVPVAWDEWLKVWAQDMAGRGHPRGAIVPVRVLPS